MTAAATVTGQSPADACAAVRNGDRLVPFAEAAPQLGYSVDTLVRWVTEGLVHIPAVKGPRVYSTFQSFIDAVLASPRPGQPGRIEAVAAAWFASRGIGRITVIQTQSAPGTANTEGAVRSHPHSQEETR